MVVAHWFERVGQILAPDKNYHPDPDSMDTKSSFWQMVAPDPRFMDDNEETSTQKRVPPANAFLSPPAQPTVECVHCHKKTPLSSPAPNVFMTPSPHSPAARYQSAEDQEILQQVNAQVNVACNRTAQGILSPKYIKRQTDKIFQWCMSINPLKESLLTKLREKLTEHPEFAQARACDFGKDCPDGATPLMAAANSNNLGAAQIILETAGPERLKDTDMLGNTALHMASTAGHSEMIQYLHDEWTKAFPDEASQPPINLVGHTPLGVGLVSPNPKAQKNKAQLEETLGLTNDKSIFGSSAPAHERTVANQELGIVYGTADMPGRRVYNEDAILATTWTLADSTPVGLFGVCDGHGDDGQVSRYVADHVPELLQEALNTTTSAGIMDWTALWTKICLQVDANLQQAKIPGGSTAVFALMTATHIVVANVGDSRCILVQQASTRDASATGLEQDLSKLTVAEKNKDESSKEETEPSREEETDESHKDQPPKDDATPAQPDEAASTNYTVKPLSRDHKPNLSEEQARIERAGLEIIAEETKIDGEQVVIHKVQLSEDARLATSRSFGDFEYKANAELGAENQAVVAVPEVIVHERNANQDEFVITACDGVWDVKSNEEVADFVVQRVERAVDQEETGVLPSVGDALLAECLERDSGDNMSVVILALSKMAEKVSGKVLEGKTLDFVYRE